MNVTRSRILMVLNVIFKLNSNFQSEKKDIVCASLNEKSSVIGIILETVEKGNIFEFIVVTKLHFE